ncbi:MAG: phosphatase PAP2 family protein [Candidatus Dojkabacteria bacterium]
MKIVFTLITLLSLVLYIPVNRLISGGYNLHIPLDEYIPLVPIFVIPYLFGIIFWIGTILVVLVKQNRFDTILFNIKMIVAGITSVLIYIFIPTYITRPELGSKDIFSNILNLVYSNDNVHNAAPSGHTFFTLLCLFQLYSLFPKYRVVWIVLSTLIISSTVLTKQHNILDIVLGIVFALIINYGVDILKKKFYTSK